MFFRCRQGHSYIFSFPKYLATNKASETEESENSDFNNSDDSDDDDDDDDSDDTDDESDEAAVDTRPKFEKEPRLSAAPGRVLHFKNENYHRFESLSIIILTGAGILHLAT